MPDRSERLALFLHRLRAIEAASDHDEAFRQVAEILNGVEDELTSIAFHPDSPNDGRMYPPQADNARTVPGRPDVIRYRSRGHSILIASNGSIRIVEGKAGRVVLDKPGMDGHEITPGDHA